MSWTVGQGAIKACAFSPDSAFAAVVPSGSSAVTLLGGPDDAGQPQSVTLEHFDQVNDCAVSPDRRWLACASDDKLIWLHDPAHPAEALSALEGHDAPVYHCAFGTNAPLLATAGATAPSSYWDHLFAAAAAAASPATAGASRRSPSHPTAPLSSPRAMTRNAADLGSTAPTAERRTLEGHVAAVWDCAVVGDTVVSAAGDGSVRFWAPDSGDVLRVLEIGSLSNAHALAPNGDQSLLAVGHDSSVRLVSRHGRAAGGHRDSRRRRRRGASSSCRTARSRPMASAWWWLAGRDASGLGRAVLVRARSVTRPHRVRDVLFSGAGWTALRLR